VLYFSISHNVDDWCRNGYTTQRISSRQSIGLGLAGVLSMLEPLLGMSLFLATVLAYLGYIGYGSYIGLSVCMFIICIYKGVYGM